MLPAHQTSVNLPVDYRDSQRTRECAPAWWRSSPTWSEPRSAAVSNDCKHFRAGGQASLSDNSASLVVGRSPWLFRSVGLGGQHNVEVLAGLNIVRFQFQSFL